MALRGVIFDVDGVLCDSGPLTIDAAREMFQQQHGVAVSRATFEPFVGTGEDNFLKGVAEQVGVKLDLERDKEATYQRYLETIRGRLQPLEGAIDIIQACLARGLRIAAATCAEERKLEQNLWEIGLPPDKFHAVVSREDVVRTKPDPEVYVQAAHRLDLSPTDCLVIEDSPAGVTAAKAAGAHCLGVTTTVDKKTLWEHGAEWTASNLVRLPEAAVCW